MKFWGRGSARNFGAHLLFVHAPGWILEPLVGFGYPEVDILARRPFWLNFGVPKTYFYYEMILSWGFRGFPVTQMNSMVPRTYLGVLLCPKPSFFEEILAISCFSRKSGNVPAKALHLNFGTMKQF